MYSFLFITLIVLLFTVTSTSFDNVSGSNSNSTEHHYCIATEANDFCNCLFDKSKMQSATDCKDKDIRNITDYTIFLDSSQTYNVAPCSNETYMLDTLLYIMGLDFSKNLIDQKCSNISSLIRDRFNNHSPPSTIVLSTLTSEKSALISAEPFDFVEDAAQHLSSEGHFSLTVGSKIVLQDLHIKGNGDKNKGIFSIFNQN